jgi:hypothetical protein
MCPQVRVELGDEACRKTVLGGPNRNPRREWRNRRVAERVVDQLGASPERLEVDIRVDVEPGQGLGQ